MTLSWRRFAFFERSGDDAGAERFGQDERVAVLDADVADNLVRMDDPGDRHAEFNFLVDNAVAADHHRAAFLDFVGAAFENFTENFDIHFPLGETDDVHASLGLAAHGINVAQRIGCRNLAEDVRIVDDGREKIHGVDDGQVGTQTIHPGVVGGFGADQHVGMMKLGQIVQNLHEVGGAELSSSTRGLYVLRQPHCLLFSNSHKCSQ